MGKQIEIKITLKEKIVAIYNQSIWRLSWGFRRSICHIKGCDVFYDKHFNVPVDCESYAECRRCGAEDGLYETRYPLIRK